MKNGITVLEAKQLKKELEEILLVRIKEFEEETGCSVRSIDFHCNQAIGNGLSEVCFLSLACGL